MEQLKILILLALPASGKSEVRKFLRSLGAEVCLRDFGLGPAIELDDFPYVRMMRLMDQALIKMGMEPVFFQAPDKPFKNTRNWLVLVELLNGDFGRLGTGWKSASESKAHELLYRLAPNLMNVPGLAAALEKELEADAAKVISALEAEFAKDTEGATVVMEFARGGPIGAFMPLPFPFGYQHSLSALSPNILEQASILYVDVAPEQARQKNRDRMPPPDFTGDTGLYHFVPEAVMDNEYGCDDIHYLLSESALSESDRPNTVRIEVASDVYHLPCALFNNRDRDLTSFVRRPRNEWTCDEIGALHTGLKQAFDVLASAQANR